MGLTLPDTFNAPYLSTSIQDFWRRWHISLSRWLRDYLYIPLGGSRGGQAKTVRNLWITMGLGGLWHGANWTFLLWGLYQGALLSLERVCGALGINKRIHPIIGGLITFHAVCLGWVLFRAQSIPEAWHFARELFQPQHQLGLLHNASIPNAPWLILLMIAFAVGHLGWELLKDKSGLTVLPRRLINLGAVAGYVVLFYLFLTVDSNTQPFVYFQF